MNKFFGSRKAVLKTILFGLAAIVFGAVISITATHFLKQDDGDAFHGADVTPGEYHGLKLSLEDTTITDDDVKTTVDWAIHYYNQKHIDDKDAEQLSIDTLTDEQTKKAFDADTVDAFYETVREWRKTQAQKEYHADGKKQIGETLLKTSSIKNFPEDELKARQEQNLKATKDSCKDYYNMTFEQYAKNNGMTVEEYEKSLGEYVEETFRQELILTAIADKENIQVNKNELDAYIADIIKSGAYESEEKLYEAYSKSAIEQACRIDLAVDWIIEQAEITVLPKGTKIEQNKPTPAPVLTPQPAAPKKSKQKK